jgi:hypothetical protein
MEKAMENLTAFGDVVEAADKLSLAEQEALIEVLHRRLIERRRDELARDIQQAHEEFDAGRCRPVTPEELMKEILSSDDYCYVPVRLFGLHGAL